MQARIHGSGAVNIATGTWNIYLDNLVIKEGSVEAIEPAVINNSDRTSASFKVELADIDDFYEFEADIVNGGKWDAMITEISMNGIPNELSKYFTYTLKYSDNNKLAVNHLLSAGSRNRIKVNVKFNDSENLVDLLAVNSKYKDLLFDLSFEIVFGQATDEAVDKDIYKVKLLGVDQEAKIDSEIDFNLPSSDTNGRGLYIYEGTENDEYPIYYYRGAVTNNNIIFAGYCWKIVRTTETGGTKLIYNGEIGINNTCLNTTGAGTDIGTTNFNNTSNNVKHFGYMYDTSTSSTIKGVVDTWYKNNILNKYDSYLEDTIWCVDRNGSQVVDYKTYYGFGIRSFLNHEKPIVTCPLEADSYTINSTNGNGKLTYPIALITGDEAQLAGFGGGYNVSTYLYTNREYWLLSPVMWSSAGPAPRVAMITTYNDQGYLSDAYCADPWASDHIGVRPSISLRLGTLVTFHNNNNEEPGSAANPYIVVND